MNQPLLFDDLRPQGLTWERHPCHYGKAHYQMLFDGEPTGWWVRWCGHPTAHYPYFIEDANRNFYGTHRYVGDAKDAAEAFYQERKEAA